MARDIELAVVAADDAFKDAGLQSKAYTEPPTFKSERFGCNIGAGLINCELNELTSAMHVARDGNRLDLHKWGREGMASLTPLWLLKYLPNMLACHVTIIHELKGPSNTITCAEASAHLAIGEAFRTIQRGKADLAICGGAESRVNPMGLIRHAMLRRLCETGNDAPPDDAENSRRITRVAQRLTAPGKRRNGNREHELAEQHHRGRVMDGARGDEQRVHHAFRNAKRRSSQLPSSTTGTKMTR